MTKPKIGRIKEDSRMSETIAESVDAGSAAKAKRGQAP
jgi:hypothetical protein